MKKLILLILSIVTLVSCRRERAVLAVLSAAEACMQDQPDSALALMQQIDPRQLRSSRTKARYSLLYSIALDKNYIFIASDSLIRPAYDYCRRSGTVRERYLANYYYGLVLNHCGKNSDALRTFFDAEADGERVADPYLLGMLYNEISDSYWTQYDYPNTLKYGRKSYDSYQLAGKRYHSAYSLLNIAAAYAALDEPDSSKTTYLASLKLAEEYRDTALMRNILEHLALDYLSLEQPEECIAAVTRTRDQLHIPLSNMELTLLADGYMDTNQIDSAQHYVNLAEQQSGEPCLYWYLVAAKLHTRVGDYKRASKEHEKTIHLIDSITRVALRQPYASLHRDYMESRQRETAQMLHTAKQRMWMSVSLLVVCVLFVGYMIHVNRLKRRQAQAQYIAALDEIQQTNQLLLLKLDARKKSESEARRMLKERFDVVSDLADTYYERQGMKMEQKAIFDKVKSLLDGYSASPDEKRKIEAVVNLCHENIMVKARAELPALSDAELDLLRYVAAGFSVRVLSVFLGCSINYAAVKKSRLKRKIAASDAPSKELFLRVFL